MVVPAVILMEVAWAQAPHTEPAITTDQDQIMALVTDQVQVRIMVLLTMVRQILTATDLQAQALPITDQDPLTMVLDLPTTEVQIRDQVMVRGQIKEVLTTDQDLTTVLPDPVMAAALIETVIPTTTIGTTTEITTIVASLTVPVMR